jgi:hypothetical protein
MTRRESEEGVMFSIHASPPDELERVEEESKPWSMQSRGRNWVSRCERFKRVLTKIALLKPRG